MENVALEIIKALQQIDTDNEYVLFVKDDVDNTCVSETSNWRIDKVKGKTYFDWEQLYLPKAIRRSGINFLHSTSNTSSIKTSVPLLLTIHDVIYMEKLEFRGTPYQNFGNIYRRLLVPGLARRSKFIITVSDFEKNLISEKLRVSQDKIKVIHNAAGRQFNNKYSLIGIDRVRSKYKLPERFILFLGSRAPRKNSFGMIDSYVTYCRSVPNPLPIVVLSYQKDLLMKQLKRKGNMDLIERFILPGFIQSNDLPLVYNAAELFVFPSFREGFGLPIIEAMSCGTPVITSNTSSMPEVAGEAAILIDPGNIEDIAAAIVKVSTNESVKNALRTKGLQRASEFSWERSARDLLKIYEEM